MNAREEQATELLRRILEVVESGDDFSAESHYGTMH